MRVGIVKPDWGISGGFEAVVGRIEDDLAMAGHEVARVPIEVSSLGHRPFGLEVPESSWVRAGEWFTHMSLLEAFRNLDVSGFDVVVSTQPPSYAVRHPRQLALFYHHLRAFYDLADVWVRAGRAPATEHLVAGQLLRAAEAPDLAGVRHFLAGSLRVQERLALYGVVGDRTGLYLAPAPVVAQPDRSTYTDVLTVSRHEFTKRTELVVQALAMSSARGSLVGDGGRLPFVRDVSRRVAAGDPGALGERELWLNRGIVTQPCDGPEHSHVRIAGRVDDEDLTGLYRSALCVVAPAYDEDYGLTVLEAMAHARPVIVCSDGGGLTELVEDGVNGFVVNPTGAAIAAAIDTLAADRSLARSMGAAGLATVSARTPQAATRQLLAGLARVAGD